MKVLQFIEFANSNAYKQYKFLREKDKTTYKKLLKILQDIHKHPYIGIEKPEALKGDFSGFWIRRITDKHRLVYRIDKNVIIVILQCKSHYGK